MGIYYIVFKKGKTMTDFTNDELIAWCEKHESLLIHMYGNHIPETQREIEAFRAIAEALKAQKNKDEHLHNVRRTAERAMRTTYIQVCHIDTFQHILDELQMAGIQPPK